jgi:hypothetical protein
MAKHAKLQQELAMKSYTHNLKPSDQKYIQQCQEVPLRFIERIECEKRKGTDATKLH